MMKSTKEKTEPQPGDEGKTVTADVHDGVPDVLRRLRGALLD